MVKKPPKSGDAPLPKKRPKMLGINLIMGCIPHGDEYTGRIFFEVYICGAFVVDIFRGPIIKLRDSLFFGCGYGICVNKMRDLKITKQ